MRLLILFLVLSSLLIPVGYKRLTGGFRLEKMRVEFPFHPEWEASWDDKGGIKKILSQPFTYLDRGSQCYVFVSEDDQYVVKIFRFDPQINLLKQALGSFIPLNKEKTDFDLKINRMLTASKLAYDRVPFETGLVYIHLNTGTGDLPVLYCKDPLGRKYALPLDEYRFVVQKKAKALREELLQNMQNPEKMKKSLDSIFSLLQARTAKGLSNTDSNLSRNLGFLDGRAIEIDFGNYCDREDLIQPCQRIKEIDRFCRPLRAWILEQAPEWAAYIDEKMESVKKEILKT